MCAKEKQIKYIDMTPDVKTDTFVNDSYHGAVVHDIGHYLESPDVEGFKKKVAERLNIN